MGATLTALFVRGTAAHFAEVGDFQEPISSVAAQSSRSRAIRATLQLLLDSGTITPEEAEALRGAERHLAGHVEPSRDVSVAPSVESSCAIGTVSSFAPTVSPTS